MKLFNEVIARDYHGSSRDSTREIGRFVWENI